MKHFEEGIEALSGLPELDQIQGTVMVVGATGLVGSVLTRVLAQAAQRRPRPLRIMGVARRIWEPETGVTGLQGNVGEAAAVAQWPSAEWLFYLAGPTSRFLDDPHQAVLSSAVGVSHCLRAGLGWQGFVFASSTRVYGRYPGEKPLNEEAAASVWGMDLDNLYDCAKRLGEGFCRHHAGQGVRAMSARLTNLYGPGAGLNGWIRQGMEAGTIELTGHPESVRNYCHVLDAVQGLIRIAVRGEAGEAYNIGSLEHFSNRELAHKVAHVLPCEPKVVVASQTTKLSITRIDMSKAQSRLSYEPQYTLDRVLPDLVEGVATCTTSRD